MRKLMSSFALLAVHRKNMFYYTFKPKEYFVPLWFKIIGQLQQYQLLHCHTYVVFIYPLSSPFLTWVVCFTMTDI